MTKLRVKGAPVLEAKLTRTRLLAAVDLSKAPRRAIAALGLPLPKKPSTEVVEFPADITSLSHGEVRQLMSYYTAFYGYANTRLGIWEAKKAVFTRTLRMRREILFQKYKPEKKTSDWSEAIQGKISGKKEIRKLEALLAEAEAMVAVLTSIQWTYQRFADTASREITARANEIEIGGRSGQRIRRQRD